MRRKNAWSAIMLRPACCSAAISGRHPPALSCRLRDSSMIIEKPIRLRQKTAPRILIVDSSVATQDQLVFEFLRVLPNAVIQHKIASQAQALNVLRRSQFDLIVVEPSLLGSDCVDPDGRLKTLQAIMQLSLDAVHVVLTSYDDLDEITRFLELGITAYISKIGFNACLVAELIDTLALKGFMLQTAKLSRQFENISDDQIVYDLIFQERIETSRDGLSLLRALQ
ncbi:response regulator [Phyllobacterium myrsinacearum]|uniref:response regulator n=1 Tax=Phyllobacterium myrsinacearum TaxID=28101 RepID=UPI0013EEE106|nr:response regulator [Phyllobacterium myrsinacearum]